MYQNFSTDLKDVDGGESPVDATGRAQQAECGDVYAGLFERTQVNGSHVLQRIAYHTCSVGYSV